MDWTTPLKFQQADFIARLNENSARLLYCETRGHHTELTVISGQRLKKIRANCRQLSVKAEHPSSLHDVFLNHLQQQLGEEAIATCLDGWMTKVDREERLRTKSTVDFTLSSNSTIGILVKACSGSIDTVQWSINVEDVKQNAAVVCILIQQSVNDTQNQYHTILAGFLPTQLISMSDGKASLAIGDLLYGGGLRSYLESLKSDPTSWEWLRTLTGGSSYSYPVAISGNGQTVASSGIDGTIKLWNLANQELNQALSGLSWSFYPVAGSGGHTLASGSTDKKLNLWQMESGELIRTLAGHTSGVSSIAISEDGQLLASGGYDGTINVWRLDTGQLLRSLSGHAGTVRPIAISPNKQILASGGIDKMLKLWNMSTGELLRTFPMHTDPVVSVAMSTDRQLLVSGTQDGMLKIWHLGSGELLHSLTAHSGIVRSVALSTDGQTLASGSMEKTIKIWNLNNGELLRTLTGHATPLIGFAVKPDGQTLDLSLFRHSHPGWDSLL